ncbi:ATP-binding protein [Methylonatrum kenyense]|uniref:ATP-binding protein n=1 Tax=Methylonatrum kenyense TaxID=455253 RepID=UPI0020BF6E03|nr:ATP-binding protein [Methylonatrum kenyense]MCK8517145.1 ATP-binding protein [Methylonatrum kenyense]
MGSLFQKLFFWFWLALLTMGAALMITQRFWMVDTGLPDEAELKDYASEIQRLYREEGEGEVVGFLRAASREQPMRLTLLRDEENPEDGRRLPDELRQALDHPLQPGESAIGQTDRFVYRILDVDLEGWEPGRLVAMRSRLGLLDLPLWVRLLIALSVTAGVSALFAAQLSRPLHRVREASRRLADGELETRVPVRETGGDELDALARDFNRMASRLQKALEGRTRLLRDISHELRSPLARMQVALELVRRDGARADDTHLERLEQDIEQLDELIGQVLAMARLDAGLPSGERETVDVGALLQSICDDAVFEAKATDRDVVLDVPDALLLKEADSGLLRSALDNVIRNAVRYTPPKSRVSVSARREENAVRIVVDDLGPGVPEAELDSIFEPFVRVSAARERTSGGHGLGLAIARRAVVSHGGTIQARNNDAGGLTVAIRLPLESAVSSDPSSMSSSRLSDR